MKKEITVQTVLDGCRDYDSVLVLGWRGDQIVVGSSLDRESEILELLERVKYKLLAGEFVMEED